MGIDYSVAYKYCLKLINDLNLTYPLDVEKLINHFNIQIKSYGEWSQNKDEYDMFKSISNFGFLIKDNISCNAIILYNEFQFHKTIRFTLLHELAHFLLEHENESTYNEKIANCFARNLIAPVELCNKMNLKTVDEISEFFNISKPAAKTRLDMLYTDNYHINKLSINYQKNNFTYSINYL